MTWMEGLAIAAGIIVVVCLFVIFFKVERY